MTPIRKFLFLALTLSLVQPAFAKPKEAPKGPEAGERGEEAEEKGEGPGRGFKEALNGLNLTDEQKAKIKELRKGGKEAHKETRESLREGRKALEEAMKGDAKKEDILAKYDALQTLRNKMGRARFEMMLAVREILTPEQRQKFRGFMEKHHGRRDKDQE
jgi:periplasmic protein CpxP/Spy